MASATGPTNSSEISSSDVPFAASLARVFLSTLYPTPPSRNFLRSLVTVSTSSLLNSTRTADWARVNLSLRSLMTASFSLFSTSYSPPFESAQPSGGLCLGRRHRARRALVEPRPKREPHRVAQSRRGGSCGRRFNRSAGESRFGPCCLGPGFAEPGAYIGAPGGNQLFLSTSGRSPGSEAYGPTRASYGFYRCLATISWVSSLMPGPMVVLMAIPLR